jgi:hypothetical protein
MKLERMSLWLCTETILSLYLLMLLNLAIISTEKLRRKQIKHTEQQDQIFLVYCQNHYKKFVRSWKLNPGLTIIDQQLCTTTRELTPKGPLNTAAMMKRTTFKLSDLSLDQRTKQVSFSLMFQSTDSLQTWLNLLKIL